ncbi:hypothetical protein HPSA50_1297 [Helicobacter pylori SouthAfrica50]|uniref:Uncharacterized protein n=1 Tax=Helicobacter pylori SouthAfrica50 TaxID=1352357 RepID=T2S8E0_HELPX|nr:hypothetical protein HPSA50_1297 [Helicobacter pylori SouthAfrica50]
MTNESLRELQNALKNNSFFKEQVKFSLKRKVLLFTAD